jgi:hypothetical protein
MVVRYREQAHSYSGLLVYRVFVFTPPNPVGAWLASDEARQDTASVRFEQRHRHHLLTLHL